MADAREHAVVTLRRALLDDDCVDLRWVLSDGRLPRGFFATLLEAASASLRSAVACATTDVEVLRSLSADSTMEVRLAVAAHSATPGDVVAVLLSDTDPEVRELAAAHARAPSVASSTVRADAGIRDAYLQNIAPDIDLVAHLARSGVIEERRLVAANPSTPLASLEYLACDSDEMVRLAVAGNPSASLAIVEYLLNDPSVNVVLTVVPLVSSQRRLAAMTAHPEVAVRCAVASCATAEATALALSADRCAAVRSKVAQNPHTPPHVLADLVADPATEVRSTLAGRLDVPSDVVAAMSRAADWRLRAAAALHPLAGETDLRRLAADQSAAVRAAVAATSAVPDDTVPALLAEPSLRVREALAANPQCPQRVLADLSGSASLRDIVLANPSCPPTLIGADATPACLCDDPALRHLLRYAAGATGGDAGSLRHDAASVAEACLTMLSEDANGVHQRSAEH